MKEGGCIFSQVMGNIVPAVTSGISSESYKWRDGCGLNGNLFVKSLTYSRVPQGTTI